MYSPTEWAILARRTRLANLHVVSATARSDGTPLALLAGRRGGTTCFVAADALSLRPPVCRLARPVTVFAFPDGPNIAVLGITRADVGSVATRVIEDGRPVVTGEPLLRVPGGFAFGSGYRGSAATVVARDGHGRILARILLGR